MTEYDVIVLNANDNDAIWKIMWKYPSKKIQCEKMHRYVKICKNM